MRESRRRCLLTSAASATFLGMCLQSNELFGAANAFSFSPASKRSKLINAGLSTNERFASLLRSRTLLVTQQVSLFTQHPIDGFDSTDGTDSNFPANGFNDINKVNGANDVDNSNDRCANGANGSIEANNLTATNGLNGSSSSSSGVPTSDQSYVGFKGFGSVLTNDRNGGVNGIKKEPFRADIFKIRTNGESPTAPEVNQWTTIMSDGTNAAIHRPGKDMTMSEAIEILYNDLKDMDEEDKRHVEFYWDQLMPTVSYLGTQSVSRIKEALRVAYRAHRGQNRKSGEPYITHPVEVALLLSGLKMDAETVMAGLLHDTVEDTDLTFTQVEAMFGFAVRSIVEGETKVSKLPKLAFSDYADEQAENLRQMFVAMTDDYRIIIVKLADRLHNMRTLRHMKPEKQLKISRETLDIFAPLAHRMGIWQFKSELEDTAFMYLYPLEYKRLNRSLRRHQTQFRETLDISQDILRKTLLSDPTLKEQAVGVKVQGRTKELYSLWYKMETKAEHQLNNVADVVALRVIIDPRKKEADDQNDTDRGVWLCYHVLGLVQHLPGFQPVPTRVKDYISFPKPNGYQSLHTALMLGGQIIGVQIRTSAMHQVAEYGMASHWAYTDEKKRGTNKFSYELFNTPWLSTIKEWQEDVVCSRDFVECVRRELLGKRVFVFLRNGKILNLAKGASVIDAAFQIHTQVGLNMHGVEINGKPVPFSYELKNGDVVSVLTGHGKPATDWMRYAKSRSTRSKLRSYFRGKQKESLREAGEILLMDFLSTHRNLIKSASYLDVNFEVPVAVADVTSFLPGKTHFNDIDDLLIGIGQSSDREFLHGVVAKLFRVPQSVLYQAEKKLCSRDSRLVFAAVQESRQLANDAGVAADSEDDVDERYNSTADNTVAKIDTMTIVDQNEPCTASGFDGVSETASVLANYLEVADPKNLCIECLPIFGDDIVGTRPVQLPSLPRENCVTIVHRPACAHALGAAHVRSSTNGQINGASEGLIAQGSAINGTTKIVAGSQCQAKRRNNLNDTTHNHEFELVEIKWAEPDELDGEENTMYLAEVVVVASDRKLLLANCSEVVSQMSEIVKTRSRSLNEQAVLEYLVRVNSLKHLEDVMDTLRGIQSVLSVERKFGTDLF